MATDFNSTIEAKGDLIVGKQDNYDQNLKAGTDGQVLAANSAADLGVEWTSAINITGDVTGNVTGDVTGNVTGNVTGDLTGDADVGTLNVTTIVLDSVPSVTGSRVGGAALASLLTQLDSLGIITDDTSA